MIVFLWVVLVLACLVTAGFVLLFTSMIRDWCVTDAPFVPTHKEPLGDIVSALNLSEGDVLYDLGCGDGRILIAAVTMVSGVRGVGYEKGIIPYAIAKLRTRRLPIDIRYGDIFSADLSRATRVYCYLFDHVLARLEPKVIKECVRGTRIVSCDFQFPSLECSESIGLNAVHRRLSKKLFVYEIKGFDV